MKITESSLRQLIRTILLSESREQAAAKKNFIKAAEKYREESKKVKDAEQKEIENIINPKGRNEEEQEEKI